MSREPWHVKIVYLLGDIGEKYGTWFLQGVLVLLIPPLLPAVVLANIHLWRKHRRTYPFRCLRCRARIGREGLCFNCQRKEKG